MLRTKHRIRSNAYFDRASALPAAHVRGFVGRSQAVPSNHTCIVEKTELKSADGKEP